MTALVVTTAVYVLVIFGVMALAEAGNISCSDFPPSPLPAGLGPDSLR